MLFLMKVSKILKLRVGWEARQTPKANVSLLFLPLV